MVESLQMFLFLFKSKYRRKYYWFSPFLCTVLIVILFFNVVCSTCSENTCVNGVCSNETCVCFEGWQGAECKFCGGKVKLTSPSGIITDGPGNYSTSVQCSWLLSPPWVGSSPPPIRVRLESFATECGWDHLYVYDGDSVRAEKLLAVFSGVLDKEESSWTSQVVARSGRALIHFFSDDAFALEGFNVTYSAYSCPSNSHRTNCSEHGVCDDGTCKCYEGWIGVACDRSLCPDDCNTAYGYGICTPAGCECIPSRTGDDCARKRSSIGWSWLWREKGEGLEPRPNHEPPPAAGHALLVYGDTLLRIGGESYSENEFLYRYIINENRWEVVLTSGSKPRGRFAHTAVIYRRKLFVYGGVVDADHQERGGGLAGLEGRGGEVTNELWTLSLEESIPEWTNSTPLHCSPHKPAPLGHCGGLHVSGHSALLVHINRKPVMLAFFGHSPHYGYLHLVQEYYIDEGIWTFAVTSGWAARAGFGHTAVWDDLSNKVYVHGGLVSESEATQAPSSALHEYDVEKRIWKPLPSSSSPRYLHTAFFISPGIMAVVAGNAHNDSGSQCLSRTAALYHVRCAVWTPLSPPRRVTAAAAAVVMPGGNAAVIMGGFDGRLRSDALLLTTGSQCSTKSTSLDCINHARDAGVACVWRLDQCIELSEFGYKESFGDHVKACLHNPILDPLLCQSSDSCSMCAAAGCVWCGACFTTAAHCIHGHRTVALTVDECGAASSMDSPRDICARFHSCAACHAHRHVHLTEETARLCYWDYDTVKCRPANVSEDSRSTSSQASCSAPCSSLQSCANCTAEECIWCASAEKCVDKNAYAASFPLGGCRMWSTGGCGTASGCGSHAGCSACRSEPACGWCDDGAGTGRGECVPGGGGGPHEGTCLAERWHFTQCPSCQCNGHSECDAHSHCIRPCGGRTVGDHCDTCAPGHWGHPLNGGHCTPCECNSQAISCAPDSGRCYCSTKGLAGDRCDKCDNTNHYHADPYNKGACYYDLAVDYQFTFNLSKKEDRHLSAINFRNAPVKADVDADFSITCSATARMNVTVRARTDPKERTLFHHLNCTNFRYKFAKSEHAFGVKDNVTLTTFFVYVYDFKPPLWIQISFSQYPKLNLQQFFITFSSCFLLLLVVAAALWKIKQDISHRYPWPQIHLTPVFLNVSSHSTRHQIPLSNAIGIVSRQKSPLLKEFPQLYSYEYTQRAVKAKKYDMYRRRQRLFVEMEQMASRPFSQVCVELEKIGCGAGVPAPVALEPCAGARAAVLSLLVRLPTGGSGVAPPLGGLAVASALVTLGHPPHGKQ